MLDGLVVDVVLLEVDVTDVLAEDEEVLLTVVVVVDVLLLDVLVVDGLLLDVMVHLVLVAVFQFPRHADKDSLRDCREGPEELEGKYRKSRRPIRTLKGY